MPRVIAIDGPAGAGKSTVARMLAEKIGYTYLDSGALYRAVTWYLLKRSTPIAGRPVDQATDNELGDALRPLEIRMQNGRIWAGSEDVTDRIRDMEVSRNVSVVSERRPVREKLLSIQRACADRNIVVEGRDIGTVVFPRAFLKVYLDADVSVRSNRRLREMSGAGVPTDYDEVYENLRTRDDRDSHREIAPLTRAPEAVYLDTSHFGLEEVVSIISKLVETAGRPFYECWKKIFYRTVWTILKVFSKIYLFRQSHHVANVDSMQGPAILAANHMSFLDPPLVAVSIKHPLHFLTKRELTEIPVFGGLIRWLSVIPVRRGILDHEAMDQVRACLAAGERILIFPEGTRSRDGKIHEAKAGFGKLVYETGVPVVPVRIVGSFKSFPPDTLFPRPSPVHVIFGKPFKPSGVPSGAPAGVPDEASLRERYDRIGREVMEQIHALWTDE